MINNSRKQVAILIALFVLINAILLSSIHLLPFIDLPNHLAEATIFKHYEPGNLISEYYQPTPWYFPNTFHTVFCSLFPSVEWGNKIFHICYILGLQLSVFLVIKELDGNPWYGFLSVLFTYNYNLTFGFVGFAVSLPALIFLFYAVLLYFRTRKFYLNFVIALILVLLFFMHAQNALMGLVLYGFMLLYHFRKTFKHLIIHALTVPVPLVILIFTWWFSREPLQEEQSTLDYLKTYYASSYLQDFVIRFRIVVFDNFQLQEGFAGLLIAAFFFTCLLVPIALARPWRKKLASPAITANVVYAGMFFIITFFCYLLVPDKLPGQTPIFQRFCTIVILAFIIVVSIYLKDVSTAPLKYFVITTAILYTFLWAEYMISFNRANKGFNESFFEGLRPKEKLAGLIYDNQYRGRKVYIHFPNYYLVWQQGITASKIIDYRFGVVHRIASEAALPFYHELIGEDYRYMPQYSDLGWLLVRGAAPITPDPNLHAFEPYKEVGKWKLYRHAER